MSKVKEFMESLKKDKKKGLVFFVMIAGLLITLLLGVLFSGETVESNESKQMSMLEVPVDSVGIEQGREYNPKRKNSQSDFFAVGGKVDTLDETKESFEPVVSENRNKVYFKNNYPYQQRTYPKQEAKEVQTESVDQNEVEEVSSVRRRVPGSGSGNMSEGGSTKSMIYGVVANDDKLVKSGSYVKIRLAEDVTIKGLTVPRNSIVSGLASYSNERMNIDISSVKIGNTRKEVSWVLYDEDGNLGIQVPESVLNDIARDGTNDAVEESSNIETKVPFGSVRLNLKKKNKEVSFVIRDGHRVYLKEKK